MDPHGNDDFMFAEVKSLVVPTCRVYRAPAPPHRSAWRWPPAPEWDDKAKQLWLLPSGTSDPWLAGKYTI